ncbi:MAG TPA: peptidase M48 [Candidatus Aenigmarchaeota archaeon]|nr:peptidase M48 [Candidatus Aenigmarchaeota archaeon]
MKLAIASFFTLLILFGFLFSLVFIGAYILGYIEWYSMLILTIILNFILWLVSPYIGDVVNRVFYKMKFIGIEGLRKMDKELADFVVKVCREKKIKIPKIGYIPDDNPQAFTYGSASFNARIVFTQGIIDYLNTDERKAVFAHEIGHIVHRDFIVMSIASTILQLLYEFYWIFTRTRSRGEKKGKAFIFGLVSYVFYWIGTYILLFLSRLREYYADEFSAEVTGNPNYLSTALLKIAYGIIAKPDKENEIRLMKSTRTLGIFDFKAAKQVGLLYASNLKSGSYKLIEKSFLFDLKSPWAFFIELSSTHPLVGKRIKRLCCLAEKMKKKPIFDFKKIEAIKIDKRKLYEGFILDVFMFYLPAFSLIVGLACLFLGILFLKSPLLTLIGKSFILLFGLSIILQTIYKYREGKFKKSSVIELMSNVYASPIRGIPVELQGMVIGRGVPGFIFSEDMMFKDRSGLIYLNYESLIPIFGNLAFAWWKVKELIEEPCTARGWFVRGMTPLLELKELETKKEKIEGRIKTLGMITGIILTIFGLFLLFL